MSNEEWCGWEGGKTEGMEGELEGGKGKGRWSTGE